jgi:hypothetical protein
MAVSTASYDGYVTYLRKVVGIKDVDLPDDSPYIAMAYEYASTIVNMYLQIVDTPGVPVIPVPMVPPQTDYVYDPNEPHDLGGPFPSYYAYAVYNLATHFQVSYTPNYGGDPTAIPPVPPSTYFSDLRIQLNLAGFVPGMIESSYDQNTGQSFVVPDFAKSLTMSDLNNLQTPWGRQYMGLAQAYGPTIWGLTP